jgi:hypothetical protein
LHLSVKVSVLLGLGGGWIFYGPGRVTCALGHLAKFMVLCHYLPFSLTLVSPAFQPIQGPWLCLLKFLHLHIKNKKIFSPKIKGRTKQDCHAMRSIPAGRTKGKNKSNLQQKHSFLQVRTEPRVHAATRWYSPLLYCSL